MGESTMRRLMKLRAQSDKPIRYIMGKYSPAMDVPKSHKRALKQVKKSFPQLSNVPDHMISLHRNHFTGQPGEVINKDDWKPFRKATLRGFSATRMATYVRIVILNASSSNGHHAAIATTSTSSRVGAAVDCDYDEYDDDDVTLCDH